MATATAEELEKFRRQWQEEVKSRNKGQASASSRTATSSEQKPAQRRSSRAQPPLSTLHKAPQESHDDWEYGYHDLENKSKGRTLADADSEAPMSGKHEPSSALEHYEKAVERESEGSLGDSLTHYRKAYRLDAAVDKAYKNKHFPTQPPAIPKSSNSHTPAAEPPPITPKPTSPDPSNASLTVPNTAHHSLADAPPGSISELIATFATLSIPPCDPPTDASPILPSPISNVPAEILNLILRHLAHLDPASFARTSLVCKRLAYLVATEERIWQILCLSPEHGLAGMHYAWACSIAGNPLPQSISTFDLNSQSPTLRENLSLSPTYPSYKNLYKIRPRLRFHGCYISTVNYHRPGAATASQATWTSPVLIVTYYRYLRFYRDGSCISLLTTAEPGEVVHQLGKENLGRGWAQGLPGAVMNQAVRGRWRLSGDPFDETKRVGGQKMDGQDGAIEAEREDEPEGVVHIETEGADATTKNPKYVYKMMMALQSAGGGRAGKTRNNKMAWLGYWSYNKLSDDWAEFGLKNDKPFFWSRVRSYRDGE